MRESLSRLSRSRSAPLELSVESSEEHHRRAQEALDARQAERDHRQEQELETLRHNRDAILASEAAEKLPIIGHYLARAIKEASIEDYAREHIRIRPEELTLQHFNDLQIGLRFLDKWAPYIQPKRLSELQDELRTQSKSILRILDQYREWAGSHEAAVVSRELLFKAVNCLETIASGLLPKSYLAMSEEDFTALGAYGLEMRARLAAFDPQKFREYFGPEYSAERISGERARCEKWDHLHPLGLPKAIVYWDRIESCLKGRHAE